MQISEALQQLKHRTDILEAEFSRLNGEPSYSTKQIRVMLGEKYRCAQAQNDIPGTASRKDQLVDIW